MPKHDLFQTLPLSKPGDWLLSLAIKKTRQFVIWVNLLFLLQIRLGAIKTFAATTQDATPEVTLTGVPARRRGVVTLDVASGPGGRVATQGLPEVQVPATAKVMRRTPPAAGVAVPTTDMATVAVTVPDIAGGRPSRRRLSFAGRPTPATTPVFAARLTVGTVGGRLSWVTPGPRRPEAALAAPRLVDDTNVTRPRMADARPPRPLMTGLVTDAPTEGRRRRRATVATALVGRPRLVAALRKAMT